MGTPAGPAMAARWVKGVGWFGKPISEYHIKENLGKGGPPPSEAERLPIDFNRNCVMLYLPCGGAAGKLNAEFPYRSLGFPAVGQYVIILSLRGPSIQEADNPFNIQFFPKKLPSGN